MHEHFRGAVTADARYARLTAYKDPLYEQVTTPTTEHYKDHRIVEFKYFTASDAKKVLLLTAPRLEDVEQVKQYAQTVRTQFT